MGFDAGVGTRGRGYLTGVSLSSDDCECGSFQTAHSIRIWSPGIRKLNKLQSLRDIALDWCAEKYERLLVNEMKHKIGRRHKDHQRQGNP